MADEQVVNTTSDTAEQPADQNVEAVQNTEEGNVAPPQQAQADKEKARIKSALSNLQKERDELKAKVAQYEQNNTSPQELEPDEDGTVAFKGANIPSDLAKELMDLRATVGELASTTSQKEVSQIESQIATAEQALDEAFTSDILTARKQVFPDIPDDKAQAIDRMMVMLAREKVGEQISAGTELFDVDFTQTIQSVLNDFKSTFGTLGAQQMAGNESYRQNSAPKSNGMGGTQAPIAYKDMTRTQRAEYTRALQTRAEAMSKK